MSEDKTETAFLNTPDLKVVEQNKLIGKGSHGKVDQLQKSLVSGELEIPINSKAVKSFDLSTRSSSFDHEVEIMKTLSSKGNSYIPHLYEIKREGSVGKIVMERITNSSNLGVAPDPEGNVMVDIALKLTEAINKTWQDGAVDIDPKLDSFKMELDSQGHVLKMRLVDLGAFFIRKGENITIPSDFVPQELLTLAPELLPIKGKDRRKITVNAEKMAVHNLGFCLASVLTPPMFWFNAIEAYNAKGVFDRKQFEEDIEFTARRKNIPPLDLKNNQQVVKFIDLIEAMLRVDPRERPSLQEVLSKLQELKGDRKDVSVYIDAALTKMARRRLFADKTYVLSESKLNEALLKSVDSINTQPDK